MVKGRARIAGAPISWGACEIPDWGDLLPVEQDVRLGVTPDARS